MENGSSGFFTNEEESFKRTNSPDNTYVIGEKIYTSEKGFAEVYRLRRAGRLLIGKALRPEYRNDEVAVAALRKEFQIGFAIDLAGAVRTFDMVNHSAIGSFIVQEYCRGVNLRKFMDSGGNISGQHLEFLTKELISCLRSLHAQGIIHRDVKPANIIYDQIQGSVKLIDFGCADSFDQLLFKGEAGTKLYKSEKFTNTPAEDWYALSVCLLELAGHCDDKCAVRRIQAICAKMCTGVSPDTSVRQPRRTKLISSVMLLALIAGLSFYIWQKMSFSNMTQPNSVQDISQKTVVTNPDFTTDSINVNGNAIAVKDVTPANIANITLPIEKVETVKDTQVFDTASRAYKPVKEQKMSDKIREEIWESIVIIGSRVRWEREKKYEELKLKAHYPSNDPEERIFLLTQLCLQERQLFDKQTCVNEIMSRLSPFPVELPADTIKQMAIDYYNYGFRGHIPHISQFQEAY